MKADLLVIATI